MNLMRIVERVRQFRSERGQAVSEYALLAFWTLIVIVAVFKALQFALLDCYQDLASVDSSAHPVDGFFQWIRRRAGGVQKGG